MMGNIFRLTNENFNNKNLQMYGNGFYKYSISIAYGGRHLARDFRADFLAGCCFCVAPWVLFCAIWCHCFIALHSILLWKKKLLERYAGYLEYCMWKSGETICYKKKMGMAASKNARWVGYWQKIDGNLTAFLFRWNNGSEMK